MGGEPGAAHGHGRPAEGEPVPGQRHPVSEMDRAYFNRFADGYSPYTAADVELILRDLVPAAGVRRPAWGCEIGCADGQFSAELARRLDGGVNLLGVDIADAVLRRYPFHRVRGSAFELPFPDRSLDLVCCAASFHHLAPFEDSLAEMNRVLAPGGLLYFLEPNYFHPQRRFFMTRRWLYHRYRKANDVPVDPRALAARLAALEFAVTKLRYVNLHFRSPGPLQRVQNWLARAPWPQRWLPYVMPWFVLVATKGG